MKLFKKKDKIQEDEITVNLGIMLGMKVCVAKFNAQMNRDEAKVGYIIARRQHFQLRSNPYEEGGMYWKYLIKFSDGSTEEYKEEEIYLDYDRRLEDE